MTPVQASLLIIISTLLLVAAVLSTRSAAQSMMKSRETSEVFLFLFNIAAVLACIYGMYLGVETVAEYQEAPEVYTTVEPEVKTIQHGGKTIYIYRFQDNAWPELY